MWGKKVSIGGRRAKSKEANQKELPVSRGDTTGGWRRWMSW